MAVALAAAGCGRPGAEAPEGAAGTGAAADVGRALDPPAAAGALAPSLAALADGIAATWLEPQPDGGGHRMLFARLGDDGRWSQPVVVAAGQDFFANWADLPGLVQEPSGRLWTHRLEKVGAETYAYSIFLASSDDGGASWVERGPLPDDASETEHGFVSYAREGDGVRAFWLDGRAMAAGEPMALRSRRLGDAGDAERVADARVCECCATDAAASEAGALVVYRDRSESELRDVSIVRRTAAAWEAPRSVADDGWRIEGCPVNGPAIDAAGERVAVAWFTGVEGPELRLAFSDDAGESFSPPRTVAGGETLGRVDLVLAADGSAWLAWVDHAEGQGHVRLGRFTPAGAAVPARTVGITSTARASGFPRLARRGERLYVLWVEVADDPAAARLRLRELPVA